MTETLDRWCFQDLTSFPLGETSETEKRAFETVHKNKYRTCCKKGCCSIWATVG